MVFWFFGFMVFWFFGFLSPESGGIKAKLVVRSLITPTFGKFKKLSFFQLFVYLFMFMDGVFFFVFHDFSFLFTHFYFIY